MEFRLLKADEIECRVATVKNNGVSLLLYKDARVDQNILDETVGAEFWQRSHELINNNLFCNVGIWVDRRNDGYGEWVWKQDVGTESYTEKEKGQASDAFKRACFNWGIGRELYTAPFIWIKKGDVEIKETNGKYTTNDRFEVTDIGYTDRKITSLTIINTKTGKTVYTLGRSNATPKEKVDPKWIAAIGAECERTGLTCEQIFKAVKIKSVDDLTLDIFNTIMHKFEITPDKAANENDSEDN